jgi:hypothetical protein
LKSSFELCWGRNVSLRRDPRPSGRGRGYLSGGGSRVSASTNIEARRHHRGRRILNAWTLRRATAHLDVPLDDASPGGGATCRTQTARPPLATERSDGRRQCRDSHRRVFAMSRAKRAACAPAENDLDGSRQRSTAHTVSDPLDARTIGHGRECHGLGCQDLEGAAWQQTASHRTAGGT